MGVCRPLLGVCGALVSVCEVWGCFECLCGTCVLHHVGSACLSRTRHSDFKRFCNKDVEKNSILLPVALRIDNIVV